MEMAYCFILKVWVVTIFPFSLVASGQSSTNVQVRQMLTLSQKTASDIKTAQCNLISHPTTENTTNPSLFHLKSWLCATLAVLEEPL